MDTSADWWADLNEQAADHHRAQQQEYRDAGAHTAPDWDPHDPRRLALGLGGWDGDEAPVGSGESPPAPTPPGPDEPDPTLGDDPMWRGTDQ